MIKLLSWNTAFRRQPWHEMADMDIDVALLQETRTPPPEALAKMEISPYTPWLGEHYSLTSLRPPRVVRTSDRVTVEWFEQVAPHRHAAGLRQMPVSGIGLSDAAIVTPLDGTEPFIVVSDVRRLAESAPRCATRLVLSGRIGPSGNFGPDRVRAHLNRGRAQATDNFGRGPQRIIRRPVRPAEFVSPPGPDHY